MCERKTVRPSVREISPVYLWWSLQWKRLEEEMCFKSRVKKRRSDWWWQRWRWQCGSDQCRVLRRWKTRMWMRLTEGVREFIPFLWHYTDIIITVTWTCCEITQTYWFSSMHYTPTILPKASKNWDYLTNIMGLLKLKGKHISSTIRFNIIIMNYLLRSVSIHNVCKRMLRVRWNILTTVHEKVNVKNREQS